MTLVVYRRQRQIMDFIRQYIETSRSAPTLKEIAQAIGVTSLATVHEHLANLESKGLIKRTGGKNKSITLLDKKYSAETSDPNATIAIHPTFVSGQKRVYVLQVKGESMIDEQIRDGDFVVIEQTESARDGDIVVALLDNGMATLKRFFKEATRVRLEPANSTMEPIFVRNVKIQGKVVGLIRKYLN